MVLPPTSPERDAAPRSSSRGRDAYQSSGRGGAGNIIQRSPSRSVSTTAPTAPDAAPERAFLARGRDTAPVSTGRGGAGNILRRPSQDPDPSTPSAEDAEAEMREYGLTSLPASALHFVDPPPPALALTHEQLTAATGAISTGRGGAGNIFRASTTSRSPERPGMSRNPSSAHSVGVRTRSGSREVEGASRSRSRTREIWDKLTGRELAAPLREPVDGEVVRGRERRVDVPSAIAE